MRESKGKTADTEDIIYQRVSLLGILPLPISQSNKHVMVEKDQEEKSSKVLINDILEYHF